MDAILSQLHYEFFQRALLACLMVGVVCGLLSTYVVLRRLVFAAVALSQLSSAGLGIAALCSGIQAPVFGLLGVYLAPVPTSLAMTLLGVGLLAFVQPGRRTRTENLVALLYVGGWAFSILLYAVAQRGDAEMAAILYGDILGVLMRDIYAFAPVAAVVAVLVLVLGKELLFTSFDPETAATYRLPVWVYDVTFLSMLALVIVFAVKMLGLMLVFAYLVAPGTAALLFCKRMPGALLFAVVFAILMSLVGLGVAAALDLPPGPAVTAVGVVLLALAAGGQRAAGLLRRPQGAPSIRLDTNALRVGVLVAVLVVVTAVASGLASHIGAERTAEHLSEHEAAASPGSVAPAPAVHFAPTVGDELPTTEDLLGQQEGPAAKGPSAP
jgi:ABC-type Mn2+/Zn2+ transport system permease subunit